jgi:hypothetical protein
MLNIKNEYKRVKKLSEEKGQIFLGSGKYKDDREIYILGAFSELLSKDNYILPEYFKKVNPPEPDFHTYDSDKNFFKQIEVVENMHWGRKRGDEDKIPLDRDKYRDENNRCQIRLWYSFIRNINKKFTRHYGLNSWLVIYHNINVNHIMNLGWWINKIVIMKDEFVKRGLIDFSNSTYEKIFILNSGLNELLMIYPEDKVIISKDAQYFMKK